jgi:excisionase family DNA binding protein
MATDDERASTDEGSRNNGAGQLSLDEWAEELRTNSDPRSSAAAAAHLSSRGPVVPSHFESRAVDDATTTQAKPASTSPPLLTTQEAASLLHVHPRTVQRLVERGQLEAVRLGAAVRFDPADVADLTSRLKRREAGVPPPRADAVKPSRAVRISFADRLRSQQHEHRADEA